MSFVPQNEMGVIVKFSQEMHLYGWEIISIQIRYPDAVLRKNGIEYLAEFEYEASSFVLHKHDIRNVDLIVCWVNDYGDCPIPVIQLHDPLWGEWQPKKVTEASKEVEYWRRRALYAERKNAVLAESDDVSIDAPFQTDIHQILSNWFACEYESIAKQNGLIVSRAPWSQRSAYPARLKNDMRRFLLEKDLMFVSTEFGSRYMIDIQKYRSAGTLLKAIEEKLS